MSGWQRIGVVISALWLIGLPSYLLIETNLRADNRYNACRAGSFQLASEWAKSGKRDLADAEDRAAHEKCSDAASYFTPSDLARTLVAGNFETAVAWTLLLLPIALVWLIGGIVFGTVRWVRRGFSGST